MLSNNSPRSTPTVHAIYLGGSYPVGTASLPTQSQRGGELDALNALADFEDEHAVLLAPPVGLAGPWLEDLRVAQLEFAPLHSAVAQMLIARFGRCDVSLETHRPLTEREQLVAKIEYLRASLLGNLQRLAA